MAQPKIGTNITLTGEKEYRAALAEINNGLKILKSELNLCTAQFADNANSVEALSNKNDILNRSILTQQEKIETLRAALQSAADEYGESSDKTSRWKIELNNAEAALAKMQGELRENTEKLAQASQSGSAFAQTMGKVKNSIEQAKAEGTGAKGVFSNLKDAFAGSKTETVGLGDALDGALEKLGIRLPESAAKALDSLNGISAADAALVGGLAAVGAAIVKVEKKLISMTNEAADAAKDIKTLSSVTGQSTDEIQALSYAANMIGVSSDRLRDSLKETTNKMQEARDGNEATALAYRKLGIAITDADGNLRSATEVFYETIDALGSIQNQTERDALAMDLMSESAQELNPLIEIGREGLQKYAEEAHEMGAVLDEDALTALSAVDEAYERLQKTQESVQNQMAAEFSPYLTEFYEKATKLIKDGGEAMERSGLVDAFGMLLETFTNIIAPTNQLSDDTIPSLTNALRPLAGTIALIADYMNVIAGLAKVVFPYFFEGNVFENWTGGWKQIASSFSSESNFQQLKSQWAGEDYNQTTDASAYYANGKYYGNKDAYLYDEWEKLLNSGEVVGSFEAWKTLKGYASGADFFPGGRTLLSENGPEMAILPQGTQILTAQETREATGGDIYYVTIEARTVKEIDDIARMARQKRRTERMCGK